MSDQPPEILTAKPLMKRFGVGNDWLSYWSRKTSIRRREKALRSDLVPNPNPGRRLAKGYYVADAEAILRGEERHFKPEKPRKQRITEAKKFLRKILSDGPMLATEVQQTWRRDHCGKIDYLWIALRAVGGRSVAGDKKRHYFCLAGQEPPKGYSSKGHSGKATPGNHYVERGVEFLRDLLANKPNGMRVTDAYKRLRMAGFNSTNLIDLIRRRAKVETFRIGLTAWCWRLPSRNGQAPVQAPMPERNTHAAPEARNTQARNGEAEAPAPAPTPADGPSPDFRTYKDGATVYRFSGQQAAVIRLLWERRRAGHPEVGDQEILEKIGSSATRLRNVFKSPQGMHAAWGTLIVRTSEKGVCKLAN
ncbi:MAG TPA: hypothetical protein VGZ47_07815 [Gemmataceae bacterium]|jgi:hypothetical protein|nr:hypothetical protein [Gemmataceae bacterium]